MDFKKVILISDLDGTLLTDDKRISEKDIYAIEEFRSDGGLFTAATGRGVAMAENVVKKIGIDIPCVIFNGAAVYDFNRREFLWHSSMPDCAYDYIRGLEAEFPDIGIEILRGEAVYVTDYNETVGEHLAIEQIKAVQCGLDDAPKGDWLKVLIAYPPEKIGGVIEYTREKCQTGVNWVHSSPMYYEMLPEGISKGYGYKKLLSLLGKEDLFTVAVGDYGNDYDMVRSADLGVAVANAQEQIKSAAKLIVSDNNNSPISRIIDYIKELD